MSEVTKLPEARAEALPADPMISMIERVALSPDIPIERLTALMDMRERQMDKAAEQVFNQAFAAAMAEMPDVPRSGRNTHLKTRYSTLDDLIRATRPVLSKHGLSLNWQTSIDGQNITVTATVRHAEGHSISDTRTGPRDTGKQMNALQGGGSTETYLKRYSGFSLLGLSSGDEADDDGKGAGTPPEQPTDAEINALKTRLKAHPEGVSAWLMDRFNITDFDQVSVTQLREANVMLTKREAAEKGAGK